MGNAGRSRQYILTCDQPWDPSQVKVAAVGSRSCELSDLRSLKVGVLSLQIERMHHDLSTHRCLSDISNTLDDRNFIQRMISLVKVELVYDPPDKENVEETGTTLTAGAVGYTLRPGILQLRQKKR
jgi:hypothetical protein